MAGEESRAPDPSPSALRKFLLVMMGSSSFLPSGRSGSKSTAKTQWRCSLLPLHEVTYQCCNLICFGIEREVACVEDVNFGFRHVPAIGLRLRDVERGVMLTPDHQQTQLPLAHPS